MKQLSIKFLWFLVPTVTLLSASCSEDFLTESTPAGDIFSFIVSQNGGWNTPEQRASETTESMARVITLRGDSTADTLFLHMNSVPSCESGTFPKAHSRGIPMDESSIEEFGVYGYTYTGAWETATDKNLYVREEAERSRNWTLFTAWPGSKQNIRFFAITPEHHNFLFNENTQTISCHIAPEAESQDDLMVALSEELHGSTNSPVNLDFAHVLTAVKFVVGNDIIPGSIEKISISGVYGSGTYSFATNEWSDLANKSTYTFAPENPVEIDNLEGAQIMPEEATFMLLPQMLTDDASIEVVYMDKQSGFRQILTASIDGMKWDMGHTVTYRISTSSIAVDPTFTVSQPEEWLYTGGSKTYTVASYFTISRNGEAHKIVAAPWTTEFFAYNGHTGKYDMPIDRPQWITAFTTSGEGSEITEGAVYSVDVATQTARNFVPHDEILRGKTPVAGLFDLSTNGGTTSMNTANCYIINAPGRYSLPLVYGNAIKDGVANTASYTSTIAGTNVLSTFINHTGNAITDPYIYNNTDCMPSNASIVWQDERDLVADVALSADNKYLTFSVDASTICQGNAVVAVRNSNGDIMWSWHIWVTDYVPCLEPTEDSNDLHDKKVTSYQGVSYDMMPINLGWCATSETHWDERSVMVRFTQTGSSQTQEIILNQKGNIVYHDGNAPYYQWGRKDPLLPANGNDNKTWYDAAGVASEKLITESWDIGDAAIMNSILNPATYCLNNYMDQCYRNLWSVNNDLTTANHNKVIKTVYDPCPVGYQMPASYAFTGFTITGGNSDSLDALNVFGSFEKGWNFHCGKNKTGSTIFFPAAGYRTTTTGAAFGSGDIGDYWTASPGSDYVGRRLYFLVDKVCPLYYYDRATGFPVRPCRE